MRKRRRTKTCMNAPLSMRHTMQNAGLVSNADLAFHACLEIQLAVGEGFLLSLWVLLRRITIKNPSRAHRWSLEIWLVSRDTSITALVHSLFQYSPLGRKGQQGATENHRALAKDAEGSWQNRPASCYKFYPPISSCSAPSSSYSSMSSP